jgi:hypothetical protein
MKTRRTTTGPFRERPYYKLAEIDEMCLQELRALGLYPAQPEPIRIERFIEKRFRIRPAYDDLPEGILGFTEFGSNGVEQITVSRALVEEGTKMADRRVSTTLAHEGGHGLLHAHLFLLGESARSLFGDVNQPDLPKILCRGDSVPVASRPSGKRYDGRWWEFQANRAMGALLLPWPLLDRCLDPLLETVGSIGRKALREVRREAAVRLAADVFEVNPIVARLRIEEAYPAGATQLTL